MTPTRLRIAPRAADITLVADPTLDRLFDVRWSGAKPEIHEAEASVDVGYSFSGRVRAAALHRTTLMLRLNPKEAWEIELRGGVSGLRADLRELQVASILIDGGASDIELDLPTPRGELELLVGGGISKGTIRRPAAVPVDLTIAGGTRRLQMDDQRIGSAGGELRLAAPKGDVRIAVRVAGGANGLTVGALETSTAA